MADLRPVLGARLGRADVHPAVHLHRVHGDDLGAGDGAGRRHRHVRLPRRRRSDDDDRRRPSVQSAATGMRTLWAGSASSSTKRPVRWCGAAPVISTAA